jgi:hypothetical protein
MHAETKMSGPALPLLVAFQLMSLLLRLSGCGDAQIPNEGPSSPSSQPATAEELDIALSGGPLVTPLQKWRPHRADGEPAPDDAD